jgi:uncharacterized protein (DUF58 family)
VSDWARPRKQARGFWRNLLWSLIWPKRGHRIAPTLSGTILVALAFGIGTAAYNSANNILFITLSFLLACFIFSGVLAWINLRGVTWEMEVDRPLRVGRASSVYLRLRNRKTFVPTYALWFEFSLTEGADDRARPESTLTGKGIDFKAILAKASRGSASGTAHLKTRLDPSGSAQVDWTLVPPGRGRKRVALNGVGSLFPFGFLRKLTGAQIEKEVIVWPAPADYQWASGRSSLALAGERRRARVGSGGEFIALRRYESGDSHRLIHWKASARTGKLLVRQFSEEASEAYSIRVGTDARTWSRPDQFELMLGMASAMAEDLFRSGRLSSGAINGEPLRPLRRLADLEGFLDRIACLEPEPVPGIGDPFGRVRNQITFAPEGARGVCAHVDGLKAAAA